MASHNHGLIRRHITVESVQRCQILGFLHEIATVAQYNLPIVGVEITWRLF